MPDDRLSARYVCPCCRSRRTAFDKGREHYRCRNCRAEYVERYDGGRIVILTHGDPDKRLDVC